MTPLAATLAATARLLAAYAATRNLPRGDIDATIADLAARAEVAPAATWTVDGVRR